MKNTSIFDIVNVSGITTEKALKTIESLTPEQILEQDNNGNTILHILAPLGEGIVSFDLKQIVPAIVAKNAEVLNLRSSVIYADLQTNEPKSNNGDNALEAGIRHDNLELFQILAPLYKDLGELKVFDFRPSKTRSLTVDESNRSFDGEKTAAKVKITENVREEISPLAFALRHGQFEMFKYLFENGFGEEIKGVEDRSKYNLDTTEGLQDLYKDLFLAGNKDLLKELHRHLGYYEGHSGQNSQKLVTAVKADDREQALKLISQGHYVYDLSGLNVYNYEDTKLLELFLLINLNHPNYNILARDKEGSNPLHYSIVNENGELVEEIVKATNGDKELLKTLSYPNHRGDTPLHLAVQLAYNNSAKALLEAAKGNDELLKVLCEPNKNGNTPLHLAAEDDNAFTTAALLKAAEGNEELLKMLLSPNNYNSLPIDLTPQSGYETRKIIQEAMDKENERTRAMQAASSSTNAASSTALGTTAMPTSISATQVNSSAARLTEASRGSEPKQR
jgi:ankyrin repeat protein